MTCDLPRWPFSPPRPRSLSPCAPVTWAFCLLLCFLLSTCTCSFFCLEYSLPYTPSGVAGCFSNFRSWFKRPCLRKAFSGHLGPPPHTFQHEFLFGFVFICLVVSPLPPSPFRGRDPLICLPLYPYAKSKMVLNPVFNSYFNCLKFKFTRLNKYVLSE